IGLMLATSGTILQGTLRNPLADPFILGVSAGGAVGAALAFALHLDFVFLGMSSAPLLAFIFAAVSVFIVYRLSRVAGKTTPETLVLAGVAVSAFSAAVLALIVIFSGNLQSIYFWLLGSLSGTGWPEVLTMLPYAFIGFVVAYFYSKELNAMLLGEEIARTLGVDVERVRVFLLIIASLLAAATVSVAGIIGFVGLIIPHFVRLIIGPNHRLLIPVAAISGMILLVLADAIARVIIAPTEIPIGVVMAIIGSPFFIYILRRRRMTGR
ncbi:MAG: iron ABC transporter permease, partial [Candidatus Saganbacteria bacterium]|nr:iron ABC transporter permease [Candidatus Saganbacteria bacterium]